MLIWLGSIHLKSSNVADGIVIPFIYAYIYIYIYIYIYCIYMYSAYKKYSYPFVLFHILLCCWLMLNCFKLHFPHIKLHSIHYNDKANTELSQLCKFIKKKNWNKCIAYLFIPLTQYLAESPLQPQIIFGYDATSFSHQHLGIICDDSSPHLFISQALSGWMGANAHFQVSPEIFDWAQSQGVAGPLKDIHRVVYKPLLLCV